MFGTYPCSGMGSLGRPPVGGLRGGGVWAWRVNGGCVLALNMVLVGDVGSPSLANAAAIGLSDIP